MYASVSTILSPCRNGLSLTRSVEDCPRGFPKLARFLDSDDAFMLYRRFGSVFSRLLLYKQDEISKMENMLQIMDRYDEKNDGERFLMSRVLDIERGDRNEKPALWPETRTQLMHKLEQRSLEYGNWHHIKFTLLMRQTEEFAAELLLKARDLKSLNEPSNRDYASVLRFMENNGGQLYEEESEFIYEKEDLITIRPGREYAWLDGFIERLLQICRCRLLNRPLKVGCSILHEVFVN